MRERGRKAFSKTERTSHPWRARADGGEGEGLYWREKNGSKKIKPRTGLRAGGDIV